MRYLVIIGLIIVAGALISYGYNQSKNNDSNSENYVMEQDKKDDSIMEDNDPVIKDEKTIATEGGEYRDYDSSLLSRADGGRVVLFFHAGWCPTCKVLEADIIRNENAIPDDLTILKINYDEADDLKDKYDIFIQHTLVQVDSSGNMISQWTGGNDLDYLVSKLK